MLGRYQEILMKIGGYHLLLTYSFFLCSYYEHWFSLILKLNEHAFDVHVRTYETDYVK